MCGIKTLRLAHPGSPTQKRTIATWRIIQYTTPRYIFPPFIDAAKKFFTSFILKNRAILKNLRDTEKFSVTNEA
jgi:hypothetical protein